MSKAMQSVLNLLNRANTWLQQQIFNAAVGIGGGPLPGYILTVAGSQLTNGSINTEGAGGFLALSSTIKTGGGGTALTAVTVPASGTAYTPSTTINTILYVSGGAVTGIAVNGVTTGLTSGVFPMKANDIITFTYTTVPVVYQMNA